MGDLIHTLPALTDAGRAIPGITFDWVAEEAFAEIPKWHPQVSQVIPIALRRWRKELKSKQTYLAWRQFREQIQSEPYDLVLDAQGLIKSAFITWFANGKKAGLDWMSAREKWASLAYHHKYGVDRQHHAVKRTRALFRQALGYEVDLMSTPNYGIHLPSALPEKERYLVFLHGTTWVSKQWPESYWKKLADLAGHAGYRVKISGGNAAELERARRIADQTSHVDALPRLTLSAMAELLTGAQGAVAVDTGFAHLAAALSVPTVSLYSSTNPKQTGACGENQIHLAADFACAPCLNRVCTYRGAALITPACFEKLSPERVWAALTQS